MLKLLNGGTVEHVKQALNSLTVEQLNGGTVERWNGLWDERLRGLNLLKGGTV